MLFTEFLKIKNLYSQRKDVYNIQGLQDKKSKKIVEKPSKIK